MKNKEGREHLIVSIDQLGQFCVGICVRKTFQNLLKLAKIGKNKKNENDVVPNTSLTLTRLGNSGVLTANPQVARSSRAGRANKINYSICQPFFCNL